MTRSQVVCTIHQPSSDITDRFDDLLLLSGGRVVYFGRWSDAVEHFSSLGHPCASSSLCKPQWLTASLRCVAQSEHSDTATF